jgi:hypothetical protein
MPLSDHAARQIAKVLRKHVGMKAIEKIAEELLEVRGDKDFRESIQTFVHALRMVADR